MLENDLITIDMIIKSIVDDLSNPTLSGEYVLSFTVDNPLASEQAYELWITISPEGAPSFNLPEGYLNASEFSQQIQAMAIKNNEYRETLITLGKFSDSHIAEYWSWKIEPNGHLTPFDLAAEIKQVENDPSLPLDKFKMGWTINHPKEILRYVYEGLKLIELSAEHAQAKDFTKFTIILVLDKIHNAFYANRQDDGTFALDQENYMQVFTAFKNGTYLDRKAIVSVKFPNEERYRWVDNQGALVGEENKNALAGWDLEYNDEDAQTLMDFLTKQEDEQDETVNPQTKNEPLSEEQATLLDRLSLTNTFDGNQIIVYLKTENSPLLSTVIFHQESNSQVICELPHVLDYALETEDKVEFLIQSLSKETDNETNPFTWKGYTWEKETDNISNLVKSNIKQMI